MEEWDHATATEAYREYASMVKEQIEQAEALEQVGGGGGRGGIVQCIVEDPDMCAGHLHASRCEFMNICTLSVCAPLTMDHSQLVAHDGQCWPPGRTSDALSFKMGHSQPVAHIACLLFRPRRKHWPLPPKRTLQQLLQPLQLSRWVCVAGVAGRCRRYAGDADVAWRVVSPFIIEGCSPIQISASDLLEALHWRRTAACSPSHTSGHPPLQAGGAFEEDWSLYGDDAAMAAAAAGNGSLHKGVATNPWGEPPASTAATAATTAAAAAATKEEEYYDDGGDFVYYGPRRTTSSRRSSAPAAPGASWRPQRGLPQPSALALASRGVSPAPAALMEGAAPSVAMAAGSWLADASAAAAAAAPAGGGQPLSLPWPPDWDAALCRAVLRAASAGKKGAGGGVQVGVAVGGGELPCHFLCDRCLLFSFLLPRLPLLPTVYLPPVLL